jgi:hypothetical protein
MEIAMKAVNYLVALFVSFFFSYFPRKFSRFKKEYYRKLLGGY